MDPAPPLSLHAGTVAGRAGAVRFVSDFVPESQGAALTLDVTPLLGLAAST